MAVIIGLWVVAGFSYSSSLEEGQGFVLVGINDEQRTIASMRFKSIQTNRTFQIKRMQPYQPSKVTSGGFYLKTIFSQYANVNPVLYKRPKNGTQVYNVQSGVVTYFGDWTFKQKRTSRGPEWDVKHGYQDASLVSFLEKNPELRGYRLFIATEQGTLIQYSWDKAVENAKESKTPPPKTRNDIHLNSGGLRTLY
ncbi:MAG: hypothetical protein K6L80_08495 [Agarilytica sp.]